MSTGERDQFSVEMAQVLDLRDRFGVYAVVASSDHHPDHDESFDRTVLGADWGERGCSLAPILANAVGRATMELHERHALYWRRPDRVHPKPTGPVPEDFLDQTPTGHTTYRELLADSPIAWTEAITLGGDSVSLPAALVFPRLPPDADPGNVPRANSMGAAAHGSISAAIDHGLLELIERDGAVLAWLLRKPMARVSFGTCAAGLEAQSMVARSKAEDLDLSIYVAESEIPVWVVYGIARRESTGSTLVSGAASVDLHQAALKAMRELVQVHLSIGLVEDDAVQLESSAGLYDVVRHMAQPQYAHEVDLLRGDSSVDCCSRLDAAIETTQELRQWFEVSNHPIYWSPISERSASIPVVKVIAPSLQSMMFTAKYEWVNERRVEAERQRLEYWHTVPWCPNPFG